MKRFNIKTLKSTNTVSKDASGFIQEVNNGDYIEPILIKLTEQQCFDFYIHNEWINATVNRIARDCTKVEWKVKPVDPDKKLEGRILERANKVRKFLKNPNNNKESFKEIRDKNIVDMLIFGRCADEMVLTKRSRRIEEIYNFYTPDIKLNPDENGNLPKKKAYKLVPSRNVTRKRNSKTNRVTKQFARDEVLHMVLQPNSGSVYGIKPMDALANSIAADILRANYNSNFFLNNGETSGILSMDGMKKTELKRFKQYWDSNFKGAANAHKIAAVNVPVKWIQMAVMNRDMQFQEYGVELRTKIFSVYAMQPVVMGVVDASTGKLNTHEQVELYKDGALRPILSKEEHYYTSEIVQAGFGYDDLEISFASIDLLDKKLQAEIDSVKIKDAALTINESRANDGRGPVPWGDRPVAVMPGGVQINEDGTLEQIGGNDKPPAKASNDSKTFENYRCTLKKIIESLAENCKRDSSLSLVVEKSQMNIELEDSGETHVVDFYEFDKDFKESEFYVLVDTMVKSSTPEFEDEDLDKYIEAINTQVKYLTCKRILSGKTKSLIKRIDSIFQRESETSIYQELLG